MLLLFNGSINITVGYLKIFQGVSSPLQHKNNKFVENEPENIVFENQELAEDSVTFTSRNGFYIKLIKPLTSGIVRFQYGVYKSLLEDEGITQGIMF